MLMLLRGNQAIKHAPVRSNSVSVPLPTLVRLLEPSMRLPELRLIFVMLYWNMELTFQAVGVGACGYILKRFRPRKLGM